MEFDLDLPRDAMNPSPLRIQRVGVQQAALQMFPCLVSFRRKVMESLKALRLLRSLVSSLL